MSDNWLSFWSRAHPAFGPGERTRHEHEAVARETIGALGLAAGARLLDFGCGYALGADLYVAEGIEVLLHDASPHFEAEAGRRYAGRDGLLVLTADDLADLPPHSLDAIVAFSVSQYLDHEAMGALLDRAAQLLKPGGALLLGDVVPPETSLSDDLRDFLPRGGGLRRVFSRLKDAARLAIASDYGSLRRRIGLRRYEDAELAGLLREAGFEPTALAANVGPNRSRRTWLARRREEVELAAR